MARKHEDSFSKALNAESNLLFSIGSHTFGNYDRKRKPDGEISSQHRGHLVLHCLRRKRIADCPGHSKRDGSLGRPRASFERSW
eukprot:3545779-Alexandrium_andersonii.AAC.1